MLFMLVRCCLLVQDFCNVLAYCDTVARFTLIALLVSVLKTREEMVKGHAAIWLNDKRNNYQAAMRTSFAIK